MCRWRAFLNLRENWRIWKGRETVFGVHNLTPWLFCYSREQAPARSALSLRGESAWLLTKRSGRVLLTMYAKKLGTPPSFWRAILQSWGCLTAACCCPDFVHIREMHLRARLWLNANKAEVFQRWNPGEFFFCFNSNFLYVISVWYAPVFQA